MRAILTLLAAASGLAVLLTAICVAAVEVLIRMTRPNKLGIRDLIKKRFERK